MKVMNSTEVYKCIKKEYEFRQSFSCRNLNSSSNLTEEQISREGNIFAVRNTWFFYNNQDKLSDYLTYL